MVIAGYHNIPLLGFLLLLGRCHGCRKRISFRYPIIELCVMLVSLLLYSRFFIHGDGSFWLHLSRYLVSFFFALTLIVLSMIDAEHHILPNAITYPAIPLFFIMGRIVGWASLVDASVSMVGGYLFVRIISDGYYLIKKQEGLGRGDGKLLAMVGGLLGFQGLLVSIFLGSILGTLVGIPLLLWTKRKKREETPLRSMAIPFGPFLSLGAFIALVVFAGRDVSDVMFGLLTRWFVDAG